MLDMLEDLSSTGKGRPFRMLKPNHHNQPKGGDNMNANHFKGKWNQFKGELKKKWGEFTDDDILMIEGDYDKFKGAVQERYADRKDEISRWADEWYRSQTKDPVGQPGLRK
jgi:uncharacterized protein YjbJ (UPF0337 family)